ncbi:MAG: hypothetical protein M5E90_04330 [Asgard group archaeon]|nr:hypothetical protein [Asgard group archaeon]
MTQNITRERKILANIVTNENEVTRKEDEEEEKKKVISSVKEKYCAYTRIYEL